MRNLIFLMAGLVLFACQNKPKDTVEQPTKKEKKKTERPLSYKRGKFFDVADKRMLYGGKDSIQHFDVSNLELKEEQFHYGIGRERFPALLEPEFISMEVADTIWADTVRFLVGSKNGETKAYSVPDLTKHEVVNDMLGGEPIMAAYCILADLGAIYERTYGDQVFTFALSGYTYFDPEVWDGLDGFIFWDRETESLWWPLIDRAVSGPLKGVELLEMDKEYWEDITWAEVKARYPDAQVLVSGQDFERPTSWDRIEDVSEVVENYSVL